MSGPNMSGSGMIDEKQGALTQHVRPGMIDEKQGALKHTQETRKKIKIVWERG